MKLYEVVINDDAPTAAGLIRLSGFGQNSYFVEANSFDEAGLKALSYVKHQEEINNIKNHDAVLDSDGSLINREDNKTKYSIKNIIVITEFLIK